MNVVNQYRDPVLIKKLADKIHHLVRFMDRPIRLMEVCGTHTHSIFHFGIRDLLPKNLELVSGPGCPVCVTPTNYVDQAILLAREPGVILTTFGDLMRVPGRLGSLLQTKAEGGRVEIVYSPVDSLQVAEENCSKLIVFLAVGFETTIPLSIIALKEAQRRGINNLKILNAHKLIPPALRILTAENFKIDGFILPGHVSAIIGLNPYRFLAEEKGIPGVVTGFEPLDIIHSIYRIMLQLVEGRIEIENTYHRVVKDEGNIHALELIHRYFTPVNSEWRGLGEIADSGLKLQEPWENFDLLSNKNSSTVQSLKHGIQQILVDSSEEESCICGLILTGQRTPVDCPAFARSCLPESPLGACMVSSEGTCAAYYRYDRRKGIANV